jgi:hypothetical protein
MHTKDVLKLFLVALVKKKKYSLFPHPLCLTTLTHVFDKATTVINVKMLLETHRDDGGGRLMTDGLRIGHLLSFQHLCDCDVLPIQFVHDDSACVVVPRCTRDI